MDKQVLQLKDKVQKLIEQYTIDKKKLTELEAMLQDRSKDSEGFESQIKKLQNDLQAAQSSNQELNGEIGELKKRNQELEKLLAAVEEYAGELNSSIDKLIPQIEKL